MTSKAKPSAVESFPHFHTLIHSLARLGVLLLLLILFEKHRRKKNQEKKKPMRKERGGV